MRTILLAGLLLAIVTVGCGSASHRAVRLQVTPVASVEDQPIRIRLDGLRRLQGVWLELRSRDARGMVFVSRAAFGADEQGVLDVSQTKALTGSAYSGVWPMGLLTAMSAPDGLPFTAYRWGSTPRHFVLSAVSSSRTIASVTFVRRWRRGTYTTVRNTVARNGFAGTLYAPSDARRRAAVLVIGGAEGGLGSAWLGERLAANGIPALTIGYFHASGLPDQLHDIPLEHFRTALEWLGRRSEVDPTRVAVLGSSFGTEAALLLGVHYPSLVHSIVAFSPTSLRPSDDPGVTIPVERIHAPVLLACGGRDQIWSSCSSARVIVARRQAQGLSTQLYTYPNASHALGRPFVYEPGAMAGDFFVPDDERAREDLWPRLVAFLRAA
jgi:dienelactone hydrolase